MHDDLVKPAERLQSDPRTQQVARDPAVRRLLKQNETQLLDALAPHEVVHHVCHTLGSTSGAAILTTDRVIHFSWMPGRPIHSVAAPYQAHVQKRGMLGTRVDVSDSHGHTLHLQLPSDADVTALQAAAHASQNRPEETGSQTSPQGPAAAPPPPWDMPSHQTVRSTAAGDGSWQWTRPVQTWQEAEQLAADHMVHLGFQGVIGTMTGSDGGLDVVAEGAAAQVKLHANPTGSPDIQRLRGAADGFAKRLFYATAYSPAALAAADQLGIATFQYTQSGLVIPINGPARDYTATNPAPAASRTAWGTLSFESRQNRATRWAQQIQDATQTPISDRKRKGARQLVERQEALQQMLRGLEILADTDNPLYKRGRRERTLAEAEKQLKAAAKTLRLVLR